MSELVLRGVPRALSRDGWWLSEALDAGPPAPPQGSGGLRAAGFLPDALTLLALLLLADQLFYGHRTGVSLALFALPLALCVWGLAGKSDARQTARHAAWLAVALLPVVVHVQALSVLFYAGGLILLALRVTIGPDCGAAMLGRALARFATWAPLSAARDLGRGAQALRRDARFGGIGAGMLRAWGLPLSLGAVFVALMAASNPVVEAWADQLWLLGLDPVAFVQRGLFWVFVGLLIWPLLRAPDHRDRLTRPFAARSAPRAPALLGFGLNPASIANSLGLFNLIFAVQTLLDLTYLWGDATLPAGMSHAEYAHRGAYPLMVTALLAGGFSLLSRPFVADRPRLRLLLGILIAQNVLLVISAIYRLDLYVESYGLTYLRVRAAIWMALVAAGLALTAVQLWRRLSNAWLLRWNALLLACVLYACCFVNFAEVIARQNLTRYESAVSDSAA